MDHNDRSAQQRGRRRHAMSPYGKTFGVAAAFGVGVAIGIGIVLGCAVHPIPRESYSHAVRSIPIPIPTPTPIGLRERQNSAMRAVESARITKRSGPSAFAAAILSGDRFLLLPSSDNDLIFVVAPDPEPEAI
jgi:hypothetical protein